ncbi:MAG TPA: TonB-dependent receptor [Pyrinomonadaceae bacterium]|nr:TonB-dependent receptor [Pyrinomonadaceae bacterium]
MNKKLNALLTLLCTLAFLTATASGQVTGGAVTGAVLDAQGAVVPGAAVTLRSKETGQTLTSQTTASGSYTFPNVPVGTYTITINNAGFQTATQELTVTLNQTTTVNATLQVAGVSAETVTVTASSEALVQTDSSQLGKTYESELVANLPIFGNQNTLAALSPNVVLQAAGSSGSGGAVGGVRPRYNSFMIDGVDNNQFSVTGPQTTVIQDAVAEFTLLTNNFNAEFGSGSGGQFNTITKSGTNEYHGNMFGYLQHQNLNAASTSQEQQLRSGTIAELPRFRNVRYGATIGGPIVRNKLFFFGAYQHEKNYRQVAGSTFLAPTAAGLGLLAGLPGASPFVVDLLSNNLLLAQAQTTTQTILGTAIPFGTVTVTNPGGFDDFQTQFNIDHLRGTKDQFRYRFSSDKNDQEQATGLGNPKFNNDLLFRSYLFSATWVRTFSPSVINDLRLSYRRHRQNFTLQSDDFNTFPNLTVRSINLSLGPQSNLPQGQFSNNYQVYDTVNYIRGSHSFKFGGEYRNLIATSQFLPRGRGDYIYVNFEDLIRDVVPTFDPVRGVGSGGFTFNQQKYYVFGQDDWKVTPNLTLNLGLRYEYVTLPRDAALQSLNAISNLPGFVEFGVPKTDKNNIAPRVGFAYSPDYEEGIGRFIFGGRGQGSIRANFSVSYGEVFGNLTLLTLPPQFQQELRPPNVPGFNTSPGFLQRGGLPSVPNPPTTAAAARAASSSFTSDFIQPETYSWALSFQRELTPTMALELRYLGTRSRHLPVQVWRNAAISPVTDTSFVPTFFSQPTAAQVANLTPVSTFQAARRFRNPAFGILTTYDPVGNSQYDGVAANVTRRFSQGLAFTASYTFSKTISDSDNEVFSSVANPRRAQDNLNLRDQRSLSDLDVPHRFVLGFTYEVPGREMENGFLKQVLGYWTLSGIFQAQSGQPFTPQSGLDANLNFDAAGDRTIFNPSGVPGTGSPVCAVNNAGQFLTAAGAVTTDINACRPGSANAVAYFAINPNAQYIQAGLGARATAGRNTLRSNRISRTDAAVMKKFPFGDEDRYNIEIGAEINNLFNQRIFAIGNFGNALGTATAPGLSPTDTAFPTVSSPLFNNYGAIGNFPGRTVQLRGKINF